MYRKIMARWTLRVGGSTGAFSQSEEDPLIHAYFQKKNDLTVDMDDDLR